MTTSNFNKAMPQSPSEWRYVLLILLSLAGNFLANYFRPQELATQHLRDTKADRTELIELQHKLDMKLETLDQRMRNIETMAIRMEEQLKINNAKKRDE